MYELTDSQKAAIEAMVITWARWCLTGQGVEIGYPSASFDALSVTRITQSSLNGCAKSALKKVRRCKKQSDYNSLSPYQRRVAEQYSLEGVAPLTADGKEVFQGNTKRLVIEENPEAEKLNRVINSIFKGDNPMKSIALRFYGYEESKAMIAMSYKKTKRQSTVDVSGERQFYITGDSTWTDRNIKKFLAVIHEKLSTESDRVKVVEDCA